MTDRPNDHQTKRPVKQEIDNWVNGSYTFNKIEHEKHKIPFFLNISAHIILHFFLMFGFHFNLIHIY